jgi:hypothetical protein
MEAMMEVLTQNQGGEVIELLRSLLDSALTSGARAKISLYRGGKLDSPDTKPVDDLIDSLKEDHINEVHISFRPAGSRRQPSVLRVLEAVLYISPTNSLWLPIADSLQGERVDDKKRRSLASVEGSFRWNGIATAPTVLTVFVDAVGDQPRQALMQALPLFFPQKTIPLAPFGWIEFSEKGRLRPNVLERLAPWPKALPMLGSRFDALHPILFGSRELCSQVEGTFRFELERPAVEIFTTGESVWTVALSEDVLEKNRVTSFGFLVPRDETTAPRKADPFLGEYELQGSKVFTRKRRRELAGMGLPSERAAGYEPMLVVNEPFCELAGIDPDSMIEVDNHARNIQAIRSEIEERFGALGSDLELRERIWRAHRDAYSGWLGGRGFFGPLTLGILDHIQNQLIQSPDM